MSLFRNIFFLLLIVNAGFLGYDFYKGGHIGENLVDHARHLNVETVQHHFNQMVRDIKATTPESIAEKVNYAFAQLKEFNTIDDVLAYVREKTAKSSSSGGVIMDGNVHVLTQDNFKTVMDGSRPALVEFYAPWCGHCKNLAPVYAELGDAFAHSDEVVIAKVDADEHRDLGAAFGVQGFPTLKWFPKGVTTKDGVEDYKGGRDLDSLSKFVRDHSGIRPRIRSTKSDVVVLTSANFHQVVDDAKTGTLVEFYASWCGHCKNLAPIYEKVASAFANEPSCNVAKIDADIERTIGTEYDISGFPTIKFFPANGADPIPYEGSRNEAGFIDFLNQHCNTRRVVGGGLDAVAGRISSLDRLARDFVQSTAADVKKEIHTKANEVASTLENNRYAKYYGKLMEKIIDGGDAFIQKEKTRLDKIIKSNTVTPAKLDDFTIRKNILTAFDRDAEPINE
ncbi:thioredoxin-like protein [Halteromyces radiatus]|uniref:thioredoxin-like protein n=1 Tax=Halteromyces radiatus TaxID=101107 RepID=UPI00221F3A4B|nr:thioredoxin-like protein [Halteromyces radiatus]KAI8093828.1 thioredoxin-like protein [Halteromyces radiatus]